LFCHDTSGGLAWRDATDDDELEVEIKKPKRTGSNKTKDDLFALVPDEAAIPKLSLLSVAQTRGIGLNRARGFISELINDGDLHEWRVKRPRTNPEIYISRHPQSEPDPHTDPHTFTAKQ
jgi:hypothetical protein